MRNRLIPILLLLLICITGYAQEDALTNARAFAAKKETSKAIDLYGRLYNQNPMDLVVYTEYFELLINTKDYKRAEKIAEEQKTIRRNYPLPFIDLGRIYLLSGKEKKAVEQFEQSLAFLNGDDILTRQMVNKFTEMGRVDFTVKTYERAREMLRASYMYTGPLSRLYAQQGDMDKAINVMLESSGGFMVNQAEDTKAGLLEILGTDSKKMQQAQKALVKKINEQPENPYFAELLTWLYTQKDDWDGAMIQVIALDERNKEQGERILEFARYAVKEEKYDIAIKVYDEIISKGKDLPYYSVSKNEKLGVLLLQLQNNIAYKKEDVLKLCKEYEAFFAESPQYYSTESARDYARLEAQYNDNPKKGIEILNKALEDANTSKYLNGLCKLQKGDYLILLGDVWEASLLYSQVDKAFREDVLGEEARFRNAKLSYYQGDFDWAQSQLTVLKASTSELIANDALYLSILITENVTPDSNFVPIKRFAYADLLLFQNKDKDAETLLDSIVTYFPEHPLKDDILMQKAKMAQKHREYDKAITHLAAVHNNFGKDVLGDDAVFKMAEIYQKYLKKTNEAKKYYEILILEYPGSTYIQTARNKLNELQSTTPAIQ